MQLRALTTCQIQRASQTGEFSRKQNLQFWRPDSIGPSTGWMMRAIYELAGLDDQEAVAQNFTLDVTANVWR